MSDAGDLDARQLVRGRSRVTRRRNDELSTGARDHVGDDDRKEQRDAEHRHTRPRDERCTLRREEREQCMERSEEPFVAPRDDVCSGGGS